MSIVNQYQKGFTLIEVLVTVILLSGGLLGLAALQGTAVKAGHNAYLRSQATMQAYDIVDRMRANAGADAVNAPSYVIDIGTAAGTTPTTQAGRDLLQWKANMANSLPQGDGSIAVAAGVVTVVVQWSDRKLSDQEADPVHTIQVETRL